MSDAGHAVRRIDGVAPDRVAAPVALGVLTWLTLLVGVGVFGRAGGLSLTNVLALLVVVFLGWPVYHFGPWRPGVSDRVRDWGERNWGALVVALALAVVRVLPVTPGLVVGVLNLPYRSASVLFDASLFYRRQVGAAAGEALLSVTQWYFEALWLVVLGVGLLRLGRWSA